MQKVEATVLGGWEIRRGNMWRIAAVFAATATLAVSGCSAGSDSGSSESTSAASAPAAEKVDAIANTVPEAIKSSGKLIVGVNIPYAPNEFKDPSGKIVGFDVDLMNAVAATLGLTPEYREADFAKIIPSIQGDTFNVGMSSFTDTKEREQTVDFVTYFSAGILWAQRPGTPIDPNNACGKKVAVQATTTEEADELPAKSKACTDAGKPPIDILKFDGQDAATNAVVLGQADAMSADSPVTAVCDQAEQRQAGGRRRDRRRGAVRLAGEEGFAARAVAQAGARAPDRDRQVQDDRDQLGCRDGNDRQASDQRRDQLGSGFHND